MCGIVGYVGGRDAAGILLGGLRNLEYRGYDCAGISVMSGSLIESVKVKGRLEDLRGELEEKGTPSGVCGIGHTRWATHGEPARRNAHPHYTGQLTVVHNGIIENHLSVKKRLEKEGYVFESETDTEAAVKLLDYHYRSYKGDPYSAIVKTVEELEGSYALGILFADHPDTLFALRKDSPLIVGRGEGENFIASDIPAILEHTRRYILLEEGEIAVVRRDCVEVRDRSGRPMEKEVLTAAWDITQAQKGGYDHFMLKEIHEQPQALRDTLHPRIRENLPDFSADALPPDFFTRYKKVYFVACGTAMHAGRVGKTILEAFARIPAEVDLASEFRYRNPILDQETLVIAVSQSGETADTLAALRLAKSQGIDTLAIVNVTGSSLSREADYVLQTYAGLETSVASTKAYSVQLGILYLLAIAFAWKTGGIDRTQAAQLTEGLLGAVDKTKIVAGYGDRIKAFAPQFTDVRSLFYIGRGLDYHLAMEGSLKLKEISYIHSESYAAGELKHGTISLITEGVPVVALATQQKLLPKLLSNVKEVCARGGRVLLLCKESFEIEEGLCSGILRLPEAEDAFMPLLSVIALQLFAYHIAVARGCDVDKPRNLAKSVTVE